MSGGFGVNIGGCASRTLAAVLMPGVVVALVVVAIASRSIDVSVRAETAGDTPARTAACPAVYDLRNDDIPPHPRLGLLVPVPAVGGFVCTYVPHAATGNIPVAGCGWLNLESYAVVVTVTVTDPDQTTVTVTVTVWVYTDCAVLERDGGVRFDRSGLVVSRVCW